MASPLSARSVATFFWRDRDSEPSFTASDPAYSKTSDAKGEASLNVRIKAHLDGEGIYAIHQADNRTLVGTHKVTREKLGDPITIVMRPACRVRLRVECPGFRELEKTYHAEINGPNWVRAAYVMLGETHQAPRPLFTCSTTGELDFPLPPGRFTIMAYGSDTNQIKQQITIEPGHRMAQSGRHRGCPRRGRQAGRFSRLLAFDCADPRSELNAKAEPAQTSWHRPKLGPYLKGDLHGIRDIAFSPAGQILATATSTTHIRAKRNSGPRRPANTLRA